MGKQQLYINGIAVDMPTEDVRIKVESNVLSDASKIMTAHSYNIALPRTINNDNIFKMAYLPSADTGGKSTHTYIAAALWVDGVPLFEGGKAVLTSVDDKGYNINLFWGLMEAFEAIKEEGLKLCDIPMSRYWVEDASQWDALARYPISMWYYDSLVENVYNEMSSESKSEVDNLPWVLPVVSAKKILETVQNVYSLTFDYSPLFLSRMENLWHALTTRKAMCDDEELTFSVLAMNVVGGNNNNRYWLSWQPNAVMKSSTYNYNNSIYEQHINTANYYIANHDLVVTSVHIYGTANQWFAVDFNNAAHGVQDRVEATQDGSVWKIDQTWKDIKVEEGFMLPNLAQLNGENGSATPWVQDIHMSVVIKDVADLVVGDMWNYVRNYPEIKVIDYINEILVHCGAFIVGSVTKPDALSFVTFDEVAAETPQSLDVLGVNAITMSLDDLTQKNSYTHKDNEDDGVNYPADGVIYTSDSTLKLERTAFNSQFKVPRKNVVALFEIDKDDDGKPTAKWHDAGDYIAGHEVKGSTVYYLNTGQDFASIIGDCYGNYINVVNRPKMIEVKVKMSVLELMHLALYKPVYIEQLGRLYIIKSVENENDDIYKLKLIQI